MQKFYEPLLKMPYKFTFLFFVIMGTLLPGLNAQFRPGERPVTCEHTGIKLADFFSIVWDQTHLQAFYNDEQISSEEKINVYFKNEPLDNVLAWLLRKRGLTWYYREETFVILPKKPGDPDLGKIPEEPTINITGLVTDKEGVALQNASVLIKGAQRGVQTDKDGKFILTRIKKNTALMISCVGYSPKEVLINGDTTTRVQLAALITGLDEVLVIAYGTSTRRFLTGSVSRITGEDIASQPVADPLLAMQGRVPGLHITQLTGLQGGAVKVELRGRNSIAAGNNPLYIVDGVPFPGTSLTLNNIMEDGSISPLGASNPLNMINVADIESIDVLKDADATAIYGSRGANGVILITTKTGKPGKTKLDANFYTGIGQMAHSPKYMNTQQYIQMRKEAFANDGLPIHDNDYDLKRWDSASYTDWQKKLLGGSSHIADGQLAISGGGAMKDINMQFRISGGYRQETTVYPGDFNYGKAAALANLGISTLNGRGRLTLGVDYVADKNLLPSIDLAGLSVTSPNTPEPYKPNGSLNWDEGAFGINPMAWLLRTYKANTNNLLTNAVLNYWVLDGDKHKVELKSSFGFNKMLMDEIQINPFASFNPATTITSGNTFFVNGNIKSWIIEPQVNYRGKLAKGELNVLVGSTFQQEVRDQEALYATGFTSDATLDNLSAAGRVGGVASAYYQYRYNAIFGRVNYNWDGKYILNLTGRRDGSSRFGPGRQFANFGAVGIAWVFSKEKWSKDFFPFLSFGKLRASYGSTGNDQIKDYGYNATYMRSAPYQGFSGQSPSRLFNPDYGWELNKKLEAGIELGFRQDKVLFRASYYRNRSSKQLVDYSLSGLSGFNSILNNFSALVQNTGLEIELSSLNIKHKNFDWSTSLNLSVPNNKLLQFPGLESTIYNNYYTVGQPLNIFKGFHWNGVNPTTGLYQFEDVDKDGNIITYSGDYASTKRMGPFFYGGLQNSLQYENWQLDFLFQFVRQNGFNYLYINGMPGTFNSNQPVEVLERWRKEGDHSSIQRYSQGPAAFAPFFNALKSDGAVVDASFIRWKNLSLSYQLPVKYIQKAHLQSVRFYLQAQNLFTITSFKGRDPEVAFDADTYPPLRIWTFGLQLAL
ncbi:SusC/RagA family TonB-linked outer membrane protein [Chitinophaga agrisoli]|uniref:SusC/RagA family TonB-linked outer membrane protein n=1 Tax=Chitinophaga agrisoli TaxID=2607653 RepID=A0A5B2VI18_9BACT|nr:SusC/RagA family TonB-linked outer membrane protein [Chitinophaga agrisoli]KAA2239223.1 SusC/RagA family TonB-linked outer membrane protein [Chitinophaga agrisoli]